MSCFLQIFTVYSVLKALCVLHVLYIYSLIFSLQGLWWKCLRGEGGNWTKLCNPIYLKHRDSSHLTHGCRHIVKPLKSLCLPVKFMCFLWLPCFDFHDFVWQKQLKRKQITELQQRPTKELFLSIPCNVIPSSASLASLTIWWKTTSNWEHKNLISFQINWDFLPTHPFYRVKRITFHNEPTREISPKNLQIPHNS